MNFKINEETAQLLKSIFRDCIEQGIYSHDEFNRFLFDTLANGISIMDKVSKGEIDEDALADFDDFVFIKLDNLFSVN